jgi:hypothetical protein
MLCLATVLTMVGCASGPQYKNASSPDAACIQGHTAGFIAFFSDGAAHVSIKEIDGVPTGDSGAPIMGGPYCFAAGKHRLGVSGFNSYQTAQDYVDLDFQAGRKYQLRGDLRGISIVFQLFDITVSEEVQVASFSIKAGATGQSGQVTVIPVRR